MGRRVASAPVQQPYQLRREPGFDMKQVEKVLESFDTLQEKIQWLKAFLTQLQQFHHTMNSALPTAPPHCWQRTTIPYTLVYPRAIRAIRLQIAQLEAQERKRAQLSDLLEPLPIASAILAR
jgi:hypothetical protein